MIIIGEIDQLKLSEDKNCNIRHEEGCRDIATHPMTVFANVKGVTTPFLKSKLRRCFGGIPFSFIKSKDYPNEVIIPAKSMKSYTPDTEGYTDCILIPELLKNILNEENCLSICKNREMSTL